MLLGKVKAPSMKIACAFFRSEQIVDHVALSCTQEGQRREQRRGSLSYLCSFI